MLAFAGLRGLRNRPTLADTCCSILQSYYRGLKTSPKRLPAVLTGHVAQLGKPGDVVFVKPGLFRNKLLPNLLALPLKYRKQIQKYVGSNPEVLKADDESVAEAASDVDASTKEAENAAERLFKGSIVFYRHVIEKENIRNPITAADIVHEVERQLNVKIVEKNLKLAKPLDELGIIEVPLVFPPELQLPGEKKVISLKVRVRRK